MTPSYQALAQIKLRETRRQRDRLNALYADIERRAAEAPDALSRLRALHEGLRQATFAQKPLHPDVANLDVLFLADELGSAPPALVAERTALLERELAQGRLRAEFTYAFGLMLGEWAGPSRQPNLPAVEGSEGPAEFLWQAPAPIDAGWFASLFASLEGALATVRATVGKFGDEAAFAPVGADEVRAALVRMARDPNALPSFRGQAASVLESDRHRHEYAGVLTILLNNLDEWDWPAEGLPFRSVWARVKYRPYLDEGLITALFLQVLGRRWGAALKPHLVWRSLKADGRPVFPDEPPSSPTCQIAVQRLALQAERFLAAVPVGPNDETSDGYVGDAMLDLLGTVEAELRLSRALSGGAAYAVQADLADFYPTVPHEALLSVLQGLGVPPRWLAFFGRFLAIPARASGEVRRVRRGLVLEHALADLFAECLLWALDLRVWLAARAQLVRVLDDLWVITASREQALSAWAEIQAFCRASGLSINAEKSGAVCLGGGDTAGLPEGLPRWGLLRLGPDGSWGVDEPAFSRLEQTTRVHAEAAPSVLELVTVYNGYAQYAVGKLALQMPLAGDHLRRMTARLMRMHEGLFGHGLVEEVRRRLQGAFADARLKERGVPEALIYWPVTAGGLALLHPLLHAATFVRPLRRRREVSPPTLADVLNRLLGKAGLQPLSQEERGAIAAGPATQAPERRQVARLFEERGAEDGPPSQARIHEAVAELWDRYYAEAVRPVGPDGPAPMPAMERLVADFINRGGEVSGRRQMGLTPYWRWVVYTYGPSLLDALGTFRFLMTELVPLQMILEGRRSARWELEDDTATQQAPPAPPGDSIPF